ncbi:hypothetical protein Pan44_18670 [Caulifigura coniformis]|uniref:DUF6268 domain-containing protein n=1 Tax=Caulifigura coniformis TaxID=2527983 RepID=A0A517SCK0_9PLAN|nr:DUF6268 family outer membrane beta-barrel protein [Caulifigura coniformis]QDT53843.1 hypothetical protein Pan44_18670 [Caulifigura coniformis]
MRRSTHAALPALCAAFATSIAAAQPSAGHSASPGSSGPTRLVQAETEADPPIEGPAFPPRIAQYPLENDPYERPPQFPSDQRLPSNQPGTVAPQRSYAPQTAPLVPEEDTGWITFDQLRLNAGVLHDSPDGLGITDLVATGIFKTGIPGVTISPQFGSHFFGSTSINNVPDQTYDLSVELTGGIPLNDDWILAAGISPGVFTDFQGSGGDLFRIPARILAFYKYSDTLKLGAGVLYLDRPDVNILPLVGLSYIPNDHFNAELWFPRPKVSWRYLKMGDTERWVYVVGEFGGGAWNIQRDDGRPDQFAYRDYRAMVGFEQRVDEGFNWFAEGGLIFGRQVTFTRFDQEIDLDKTVGLQFGVRF